MSIGERDSQHHGRTPASRSSLYKSHNLVESSRKESPCTAGAPRPVTFAHLGTLLLGSEEGLLSASMAQPGLDGTHSHPSPSITPHPYMVKVYNLFPRAPTPVHTRGVPSAVDRVLVSIALFVTSHPLVQIYKVCMLPLPTTLLSSHHLARATVPAYTCIPNPISLHLSKCSSPPSCWLPLPHLPPHRTSTQSVQPPELA